MDSTNNQPNLSRRTLALMTAAAATAVVVGSIGIATASAGGEDLAVGEEMQFAQPVAAGFSVREFLIQYVPGAELILGTPDGIDDWGDCPACGMG
ncbi:MAG: hypothetical protein HKN03_09250 [Acidimicrobiales bacterium]|nr:hypothetical protein [Acidimicrobiales bacterium]